MDKKRNKLGTRQIVAFLLFLSFFHSYLFFLVARVSTGSAVKQQCSSAADKGWRFVPDAILLGHRRAPQWVPARTPTVHWGPDSGEAVGGPSRSDSRYTANTFATSKHNSFHFQRCLPIEFSFLQNLKVGKNSEKDQGKKNFRERKNLTKKHKTSRKNLGKNP